MLNNKHLEFTGKFLVRNENNDYLIKPLPAFKKDIVYADYWTDYWGFAFRFSGSHAQDQINLTAWDHKLRAVKVVVKK